MKPKKLIFSLAALWGGRTNETNWKYENAVTLLDHIKKRNKMDVFYGFELGNEIYGDHGHAAQIKPDIAAEDFATLRELLSKYNKNWKIIGTDTAMDIGWTIDFFKINPTAVDIFTWHEYPLGSGGSDDVAEKIMDPNFIEKVAKRIETYKAGVQLTDSF